MSDISELLARLDSAEDDYAMNEKFLEVMQDPSLDVATRQEFASAVISSGRAERMGRALDRCAETAANALETQRLKEFANKLAERLDPLGS